MSVNALDTHGTLLAVQLTVGGAFTTIAEINEITIPGRSRNEFDASTQNENIDAWVLSGLMRRTPLKLKVNYIPTNATQSAVAGMDKLFNDKTMTGYRTTYPDGTYIISSGQIQAIGEIAAKLTAEYTIRFSSVYNNNGSTIGT